MTNEYMYSTILLFHTLLLLLEKNQIFGPNTLQFLVIFFSPFIKPPVYTPAQLKVYAILCTLWINTLNIAWMMLHTT